jgi:hypothetical protein
MIMAFGFPVNIKPKFLKIVRLPKLPKAFTEEDRQQAK